MSDIFACFSQNSEYISIIETVNPSLKIELNFNRLYAYLYDSDNPNSAPIFRYNESDDERVEDNLSVPKLWQKAYAEFIENPKNYLEDEHFAGAFALTDIDNDGTPELIIAFFNGVEAGYIFANIYSYDGKINRIGQRIDMYYKSCWISSDPLLPGLFVEGGRNSTFACNYWSIIDNKFVSEPLWTYAYNSDIGKMEYKEISNNSQLIDEAKKVVSVSPEGTVDFFEINENNIQLQLPLLL